MVGTTSSPGSGYFHARSAGWPTLVSTRYISPTLRWSCWNVAMRLESGDHARMGRLLLLQPALSVAYPKSFAPSVVICVSLPVATSRTHRFQSRMNAACFLSGETDSGITSPPRPAPPPPPPHTSIPPRPPRPRPPLPSAAVHLPPIKSHVHRPPACTVMDRPSGENSRAWNDRFRASKERPVAAASAAATLA